MNQNFSIWTVQCIDIRSWFRFRLWDFYSFKEFSTTFSDFEISLAWTTTNSNNTTLKHSFHVILLFFSCITRVYPGFVDSNKRSRNIGKVGFIKWPIWCSTSKWYISWPISRFNNFHLNFITMNILCRWAKDVFEIFWIWFNTTNITPLTRPRSRIFRARVEKFTYTVRSRINKFLCRLTKIINDTPIKQSIR